MSRTEWILDFQARLERLQPLLPPDLRGRAAALAEYRDHAQRRAYDHAAAYHQRQLHALQFPPVNADWNGELACVPGALQAEGSQSLPAAATADVDRAMLEQEAGGFGRFRVYYRRFKITTSRTNSWVWMAYLAERVELQTCGEPAEQAPLPMIAPTTPYALGGLTGGNA